MRNVLMIAQKFPPLDSSGTARPLYFSRYLADFGYWPVVIAEEPRGRGNLSPETLRQLEGRCEVHRLVPRTLRERLGGGTRGAAAADAKNPPVKAVPAAAPTASSLEPTAPSARADAARRLPSLASRMRLSVTRNVPWVWPVIAKGLELFHTRGFDLIWATCDPLTSLVAAYHLSRLTARPFIADIRDPITYGTEWATAMPVSRTWIRTWEQKVLHAAARTVYTSPLTTEIMQRQVRPSAAERMLTITNGFLRVQAPPKREFPADKLLLRHIGIVAPHRDPEVLLRGLGLACADPAIARDLRLQMAGAVTDYDLQGTIDRLGVREQVEYLGFVPHSDVRPLARGADVLVLYQPLTSDGCDIIMGKCYESLSANRPILALVPPHSGDAWLLREARAGILTGVDRPEQVADGLRTIWRLWKAGRLAELAPQGDIARFERRNLTGRLAAVFDEVLEVRE